MREEKEEKAIQDAGRLTARMIYEVVRRDGEEELHRRTASPFCAPGCPPVC